MFIYQSEFSPTWLYIKTHKLTGLKYFGKTASKNPYRYNGSGKHWKRHLKIHGNDIHTELIGPFYSIEDIQLYALMFSLTNNIVKSTGWANLINENGLAGASTRTIESIQQARLTSNEKYGVDNWSQSVEGRAHSKDQVARQIKNGKHISTNGGAEIVKRTNKRMLSEGTHSFQGERGSIHSRELAKRLVNNGTHNFLSVQHSNRVSNQNKTMAARINVKELKQLYKKLNMKQPQSVHRKSDEWIAEKYIELTSSHLML